MRTFSAVCTISVPRVLPSSVTLISRMLGASSAIRGMSTLCCVGTVNVGGTKCGVLTIWNRRACCHLLRIISPELTRANFLSPEVEEPPMTPPVAKQETAASAATTAATPAAIAIRFAGNGSFAPLAVALAIASPLFAAVLAVDAAASPAVAAASVVDAAVCSQFPVRLPPLR